MDVKERLGHDMRYAIDPTKIHNELGWLPEAKFAEGIKKTIKWYLDNRKMLCAIGEKLHKKPRFSDSGINIGMFSRKSCGKKGIIC